MLKDEDPQVIERQLKEEIQRLTEQREFLFNQVHCGASWIDRAKVWTALLLIGLGLMGVFAVLREGLTAYSAIAICIGGSTVWVVLKRERQAKLEREALSEIIAELDCKAETLHRLKAQQQLHSP